MSVVIPSDFTPRSILKEVINGCNVLFVSFRLNVEKKDGVSLEVEKWAKILHEAGANVYYYSGETRTPSFVKGGRELKIVHFLFPDVMENRDHIFKQGFLDWNDLSKTVEDEKIIRNDLAEYVICNNIEYIVAENILAYPGNIALSLATVNVCNDFGIKLIAHNHDHWFERVRFKENTRNNLENLLNRILDRTSFLFTMVINSKQKKRLVEIGKFSTKCIIVSPNVMDFEKPLPTNPPSKREAFREAYSIGKDETVLLLPVRPVPRKELHLAIDVVALLQERKTFPKVCAFVTHPAGDEGMSYWNSVVEYAKKKNIHFIYKPEIDEERKKGSSEEVEEEEFTLDDCYLYSDIVLYTSSIEGWGNALIEAVYFKKPIIINPYDVYQDDIEPKGLNCINLKSKKFTINSWEDSIDINLLSSSSQQQEEENKNKVTLYLLDPESEDELINEIETNLLDPRKREEMVVSNLEVSKVHFSFDTIRNHFCRAFLRLNKSEMMVKTRSNRFGLAPSSISPRSIERQIDLDDHEHHSDSDYSDSDGSSDDDDDNEEEGEESQSEDDKFVSPGGKDYFGLLDGLNPFTIHRKLLHLTTSKSSAEDQGEWISFEEISQSIVSSYQELQLLQQEQQKQKVCRAISNEEIRKDLGILLRFGIIKRHPTKKDYYKIRVKKTSKKKILQFTPTPSSGVIDTKAIFEISPEELFINEFYRKRSQKERETSKDFMMKQIALKKYQNYDPSLPETEENFFDWNRVRKECKVFFVEKLVECCRRKDISRLKLSDFHKKIKLFGKKDLSGLLDWYIAKFKFPKDMNKELVLYKFKEYILRKKQKMDVITQSIYETRTPVTPKGKSKRIFTRRN